MPVSPCHFQCHSAQLTALVLVIVAYCPGCGPSPIAPLPVYPVKGEVFVGGKPAEGAVIAFHPTNRTEWRSATSRAVVDREGRFSLTTYVANDGAPEGKYIITVYWPGRALDPSGEGGDLPADKLGKRFAKMEKSKLRVQLGRKPVTLARVDLKHDVDGQGEEFHFVDQEHASRSPNSDSLIH